MSEGLRTLWPRRDQLEQPTAYADAHPPPRWTGAPRAARAATCSRSRSPPSAWSTGISARRRCMPCASASTVPMRFCRPPANVMGVLSLVFWSLVLVISGKYLIFVLRADNDGEGGILALTALATPIKILSKTERWPLVLLGIFGAALLYGDGMITPAISVLSAVEGLEIATPIFTPYVIPATIAIIIGLFLIQSHGTGWRRQDLRAGDVRVVRHAGVARCRRDRPAPGRARRGQSGPRGPLLRDERLDRLLHPGDGGARHHRRRVALRRPRTLRPPADSPRLVRGRDAGTAAELFRPGRAAHRRPGGGRRTRSICWRPGGRSIRWSCWRRAPR